jgi:hypothetical protein
MNLGQYAYGVDIAEKKEKKAIIFGRIIQQTIDAGGYVGNWIKDGDNALAFRNSRIFENKKDAERFYAAAHSKYLSVMDFQEKTKSEIQAVLKEIDGNPEYPELRQ